MKIFLMLVLLMFCWVLQAQADPPDCFYSENGKRYCSASTTTYQRDDDYEDYPTRSGGASMTMALPGTLVNHAYNTGYQGGHTVGTAIRSWLIKHSH